MNRDARAERNARMKARLRAEGQRATTLWAPEEELNALKRAYPGVRGGTDWRAVIKAALNSPAPSTVPAEPLPDNKATPVSPKPTPLHDNEAVVSYQVHGIDAARRCQAKNRSGDRCRDAGTLIRTEVVDGQRCEFDTCHRHGKAEFFTPHPSVLAKGPTAQS